MIADYKAFLPEKRAITLPLIDGSEKTFSVALNIPVGLFNRIVSSLVEVDEIDNQFVRLEILSDLVVRLIHYQHPDITQEWVLKNISINTQKEFVVTIYKEIQSIITSDIFAIPQLKVVKKKPNTKAKNNKQMEEKEKVKAEIDYYEKLLKETRDYNLIDDIAILSMKTNNSFSEIQAMPIFVFRDMVRAVVIGELRTDDDYNLAYLKYESNKYQDRIKDYLKKDRPQAKKGMNVAALDALMNRQ